MKGTYKVVTCYSVTHSCIFSTDKSPVPLESSSDCDTKKALIVDLASHTINSKSLSLIPHEYSPKYNKAASHISSASSSPPSSTFVATNNLFLIPPLPTTVVQVDSDSDDEPSLLKRLQTYKHQPPLTATRLHIAQQVVPCTEQIDPQTPYKLPSPVLLASSDEDELPLFSRLRISKSAPTTTKSATTKDNQTLSDSRFYSKNPKTNSGSKEIPILID